VERRGRHGDRRRHPKKHGLPPWVLDSWRQVRPLALQLGADLFLVVALLGSVELIAFAAGGTVLSTRVQAFVTGYQESIVALCIVAFPLLALHDVIVEKGRQASDT
jgi:hypothetical protein